MNLVCSYLKRFKTLLALVLFLLFFFLAFSELERHKSKIQGDFTCSSVVVSMMCKKKVQTNIFEHVVLELKRFDLENNFDLWPKVCEADYPVFKFS